MASRHRPPTTAQLDDKTAERVRQSHHRAITALQAEPAANGTVTTDVELADATEVPVPHGLGRRPVFVSISVPRDPSSSGRVEEIRSDDYDRARYVVLKATGWGATITVDVWAM